MKFSFTDPREGQGRTVLVVDDEPEVGETVADYLRAEGYDPITCRHPQQAIECSEETLFNLAFLDIKLPDMSGFELATRLKRREPQSEIVFMTGYGTLDNAVQAIKTGAYDYLKKPFGINELRHCLTRYQERLSSREIKISDHRYFDLLQNVPLLVFELKSDFRLQFVNKGCFRILGYHPDEAMKNPDWFLDRIQPDDRERIIDLLGVAFKAGNLPFSTECRMRHKNGHTVHTIIKITPDSEGGEDQHGVKTLAGIIVDITDRVFLEQTLVQREKLKTLGAISAEVAHVIRNPLVSIGGFARRLKYKFPKLPEGNIILQESERLEKILYRITEYLKPVEVSYQTCSINGVLKDCVALLLPEMKRLNIACRMNPDPSLSAVPGDKDLLSQIFAALIQNAIGEMKPGGTLLIRTFESEENIHVEFRNQNLRSKARDTECYFMPFDKGDQKMGLPYSIRVLKNMGGLLSVSQEQNDMVFEVSHPKKILSVPDLDGLTENPADLFMPVSDTSPAAGPEATSLIE